MAEKTGISWTDHTFNIAWGCAKVSPGCANCYADGLADKFGYDVWGKGRPRRTFGQKHWNDPARWNRKAEQTGERRRVFCSSMCDIFEDHPTINEERERLWPIIRQTPWLDWQLLTKRPERIAENLPSDWRGGYPNVWLGTSVENNDYAHRADHLRPIEAAVRFLSYEPALGPLDMLDLHRIDWVIYGGESGHGRREHEPAWACHMRDMCKARGVSFYYKQSSGLKPGARPVLDGAEHREFPEPRVTQ